MTDIDIVREEILSAIESLYPKPIQPGEITSRMIMDRLRIDKTTAYRILAREVKDGKLVEVKDGRVDEKGRPCKAWRKPIEPPEVK